MRIKFVIIATIGLANFTLAQSSLEFWPYPKPGVEQRNVIPHRYTREAAIKFHKRIHRVIDVREKQNLPMQWPRSSFAQLLYNLAAGNDPITVYSSDSLTNGSVRSPQDIKEMMSYTEDITLYDANNIPYDSTITVYTETQDIKKFRIMEDWLFDATYSDFRPRIVAIAPQVKLKVANGIDIGEANLFWIMMDDIRPTLVRSEVFNPANDAARLSYDDWFTMRMFSSYIVKESNPNDEDIKYYERVNDDPFAALMESERVKEDLFVFEHDLWEY